MDNWLVQGSVCGLVTTVIVFLARWGYDKAGFWNERLGLALNRAELRKVRHLASDRLNVIEFLLIQVLWCFGILAIAALIAPLAYATGGQHWMGVVVVTAAFIIYGCVVFPLGIIVRLRKGDEYIRRQELRIERGEKVLEKHRAQP